jgi:hypothetical protein
VIEVFTVFKVFIMFMAFKLFIPFISHKNEHYMLHAAEAFARMLRRGST